MDDINVYVFYVTQNIMIQTTVRGGGDPPITQQYNFH